MNTITLIIFIAAITLSIFIPFLYFARSSRKRRNYRITVGTNALAFFGTMLIAIIVMFGSSDSASAAEAAGAAAEGGAALATGLGYLGAALATGLSCVGAGIAVSSAASAALGALSEDSSIMGKSLIFVGLAEGVALYGLIISFMILGQL